MATLKPYQAIIDNKPIHIATVTADGQPNLAVASDVRVLNDEELIISVNEMTRTQVNLQHQPRVVITAFDQDWKGVRIFGTAKFYSEGEYYEFCAKTFFGQGETSPFGATKPKGAIVVKVERAEAYV